MNIFSIARIFDYIKQMTPVEHPEHLEHYEYVDRDLRDLQSDVIDYRLLQLLESIRIMRKEILGTDIPKNREAVCESGVINIVILPTKRGESVRYVWQDGINSEKLFFDSTGKAIFLREIEGIMYEVTITKVQDVGTMSLKKVGAETVPPVVETKKSEAKVTPADVTDLDKGTDTPEVKRESLDRIGDLPEGSTVRMHGPILIVEDKEGYEIGMFDMSERDLSRKNIEYDGLFFWNTSYPALYDLYVTNIDGRLLFEFEKRPFDETPFEKKVTGSAVPAWKEWVLYFSNGEVGIVEIMSWGRPTLIANLGVVDVEKLHEQQLDKKIILPRGDVRISLYYLDWKFYTDAMLLGTRSYIPSVETTPTKLPPVEVTVDESVPSTQPPVLEKVISGELTGEKIADLTYGLRVKFGEYGPEFGKYDMTIRSLKDSSIIDGYYLDFYRWITIEAREFGIRRKKKLLDDRMLTLDLRTHELMEGASRSYIDTEGDPWRVKAILDDKKILRIFVDAPLEKKAQKDALKEKKPKKDTKKVPEKKDIEEEVERDKWVDSPLTLPDRVVFPEFDNVKVKTIEEREKVKEKTKQILDKLYEKEEVHFSRRDIRPLPMEPVTLENETIKVTSYAERIYGLPPYSQEDLSNIRVVRTPPDWFKLRLVTKYFDWKKDKDLVKISWDEAWARGQIIEKDWWQIQLDVDSKGTLFVSAAPPENKVDDVVTPTKNIETKGIGFAWPVDEDKVESWFGMRNHPNTRKREQHNGIDIALPSWTPVKAPYDGVVLFVEEYRWYGQTVVLEHKVNDIIYRTVYAHLLPSSVKSLATGQTVKRGDSFAKSGGGKSDAWRGNSTWPHLHFEIRVYDKSYNKWARKYWRPIDPLDFYNLQQIQPSKPQPQPLPQSPITPPKKPGKIEYQETPYKAENIPIPSSEAPIEFTRNNKNEVRRIKSLGTIIKNFADNDLAKIPYGRYASYENDNFVLADKWTTILILDDFYNDLLPFTYIEQWWAIESKIISTSIQGMNYKIKVVIFPFWLCAVRMEQD